MRNEEKILNSLDKLQKDIDSIKQDVKAQNMNQPQDDKTFNTIVRPVKDAGSRDSKPGSSRLEGDIDTI